jgi:hypothetical protein
MIVGVAIQKDGVTHSMMKPHRHHNLLQNAKGALKGGVQGFVDEDGKFYDRKEAEVYARECGQHTKKNIGGPLTSEDLW